MRVTQDPLNVNQGDLRVGRHPVRGRVPQVMQRPVAPQRLLGPAEHHPRRVIAQGAQRAAQRPPHRVSRASRDPAAELLLIQPQPYERIDRRGKHLLGPGSLTHDRDHLVDGIDPATGRAQQLARPRRGRDPECQQRPVAMRGHRSEHLVEPRIRNRPRDPPDSPGLVRRPAHRPERFTHRVTVRVNPLAADIVPGPARPSRQALDRYLTRRAPRNQQRPRQDAILTVQRLAAPAGLARRELCALARVVDRGIREPNWSPGDGFPCGGYSPIRRRLGVRARRPRPTASIVADPKAGSASEASGPVAGTSLVQSAGLSGMLPWP